MKTSRIVSIGVVILPLFVSLAPSASGQEKPPDIKSIAVPKAGYSEIIFHGTAGPFQIQTRASLDPASPWVDMPGALVTELEPGAFLGQFPYGSEDLAFYRVVSQAEGISALNGWTVLLKVSPPANGAYFVAGESPVVTVTILDTFAQGLGRTDFSSLSLYMYGPQDPRQTVTAVKLLNASTNRSTRTHHYIDLRTHPDVQVNGDELTYHLKPVTDELPGTYTVTVWSVLASDNIQQIMKFANVQIGTTNVEKSLVVDEQTGVSSCAACHKGPISGRLYMHHIDPGFSPTGNWSLDYTPVKSCKSCHNNDGYSAYADASAPGGQVPDPIVRRVHGVHMGENLKLPFNIDPTNGDFKPYIHLTFPADVRSCTKCHVDDRWQTQLSRLACASCHDNTWFGLASQVPAGMVLHKGGTVTDDNRCALCHSADGIANGVDVSHKLVAPGFKLAPAPIDVVDVTLTPPANGSFYVAGEKPVVTLVIKDDAGNPIDHTKVTDGNFSTASLFVYGPRSRTVPVLTSAARNVNSTLRASVSNNKDGPWAGINGKIFTIAINGSAPRNITIVGAGDPVTAAEVVASLNPVITNLNGGAKAFVSGARVNIKTLIQGANARIEIYNGDVTTAMVWKRPPNTVTEPDVTVAASSIAANDLRALSDPLDYHDPMVTRTTANVTYQLDDVAGLTPGSYGIYVYHLPKAAKIAGLTAPAGIGHIMFQHGRTINPDLRWVIRYARCPLEIFSE